VVGGDNDVSRPGNPARGEAAARVDEDGGPRRMLNGSGKGV
jgi:hypothetical protein